jgi:hypothetical protein
MHKFGFIVMTLGILSLLSAMPLAAQVANSDVYTIAFTAPFPFYAGSVKLPAGSYTITQPDQNTWTVRIRDIADTKGGYINFRPTSSADPQKKTYLTFHKYGNTGYLQTLSIAGDTDGIAFPQTKAEAKAKTMAENTNENTTVVEQAMLVGGK